MSTDIHSLDQYIGQYVELSQGKDGMAGFMVDVRDDVEYLPYPVRSVTLDYGYGWQVSADTVIKVVEAPDGQTPPQHVENPIHRMHRVLDGKPCSDAGCVNKGRALLALRDLRIWRMRQAGAYWEYTYVRRVRKHAEIDLASASGIATIALLEGAPSHIVTKMNAILDRATKRRS